MLISHKNYLKNLSPILYEYKVTAALTDELAQTLTYDWLATQTYFYIDKNMCLYIKDKAGNEYAPYVLSVKEELDDGRIHFETTSLPEYPEMILYLSSSKSQLVAFLHYDSMAVAIVKLSKETK